MSLYRTWRPKSFADLVGQDAVVRTLTTALDTGRLAHAYLFSGPRGSGKTSAAKILARCIECEHGPTATPDNDCQNCQAILAGTALDVLEIDAASNRGIDEIRALRDAVKFAPATMRMKVYIIDEAHMLTKEGANAFLKTLEEPPPYAVFILATTAPESLPPTILSRCQRYAFRRIPIATMVARMRAISAVEGISIDDGALGAIAYRADGGLRDALTMLEQVAAFANGPVDADTVDAAFGQTGREFARRLVSASLAADPTTALVAIDEASDAGCDMAGLIRATNAEFRHLLVARINPELLGRDLSADDAALALERARATPQARLIRALRLLSDALAAARASGNARLELETATLRFILQHEDPSLEALAARVAALESGDARSTRTVPVLDRKKPSAAVESDRGRASRSEPEGALTSTPGHETTTDPSDEGSLDPANRTAPPASNGTVRPPRAGAGPGSFTTVPPAAELSVAKLRLMWQSVITRAVDQKPSLRAHLSRVTLSGLDGDTLTVSVPDKTSAEALRANLTTLRAALAELLGRPLDLRFQVEGRPATGVSGRDADVRDADPNDETIDLVRYALDTLP